jgi:NAD(P)H-hydrate epimerase
VGARKGTGAIVLTPHPGEMSRLTGRPVEEILNDRENSAREAAAGARATVVLKGAATAVADPGGELYINPTGSNGLASGGSGDVLTGVVAALLGQGLGGTDAAALGAFVHGLAGDLAAEAYGEAGMIAGDVLDHVPPALMELGEARA